MFFRDVDVDKETHLQIVAARHEGEEGEQRVLLDLGSLEELQRSGELESLIKSGSEYCPSLTLAVVRRRHLSSHEVAELVDGSPSTVRYWIGQGILPAYRTPGGHRRIKTEDLCQFLEQRGMPIPEQLQHTQKPQRATRRRKQIFVVDDRLDIIESVKRLMAAHADEYEVEGCRDGFEALVRIGQNSPDLVLLDIYMPHIDGFEVCRRLRSIEELKDLKIVAMTGFASEEARARIMSYGADAYLEKPLSAKQILNLF